MFHQPSSVWDPLHARHRRRATLRDHSCGLLRRWRQFLLQKYEMQILVTGGCQHVALCLVVLNVFLCAGDADSLVQFVLVTGGRSGTPSDQRSSVAELYKRLWDQTEAFSRLLVEPLFHPSRGVAVQQNVLIGGRVSGRLFERELCRSGGGKREGYDVITRSAFVTEFLLRVVEVVGRYGDRMTTYEGR